MIPPFNRNYGHGDSTPYLDGAPKVEGQIETTCPNCKCGVLFKVMVRIKNHPQLRTGKGYGRYLGCAACPFASEMIMIAGQEKP